MHEIEQNWELIKSTIKKEYGLTDVAYTTWIEITKFHSVEGNVVTIVISSDQSHILDYVVRKYKVFFQVTISELMNCNYEVNFILKTDIPENHKEEETVITAKDINNEELYKQANLNSKYTFDNFVVGGNNNFAHSACLAVAESPGEVFNPLFIYGGPGLGKTHLMHSIGHYILDTNPNTKVLYVNSENFTNEVIESIRSGNSSSINKLRDKYRTVDVLLIDDIQFIIGKEMTQEEFFHTFNSLYNAGKAIIISSDKHPKQMETLEERFSSRFQQGLTADIQPPNYETRVAILLKIAESYGKTSSISNEVIEYIANNIKSNIRELEGAFNKLIAFSKISNREITMELAEEALKDMIYPDKPKVITPTIIIDVVAEHYGLTTQDILSNKRNQEIVNARHVAMYLCRELTDISLNNIGKIMDKKDHTTVLHGVNRIEEQLETNKELYEQLEIIKKKIIPN